MAGGAPTGNQNAVKSKPITEAVIKALHEECVLNGTKTKKLFKLARTLVDRAIDDGDLAAIKEILDRVEGKPAQSVTADVKVTQEDRTIGDIEREQRIAAILPEPAGGSESIH